jgi:hypothetical protein
MRQPDNLPACQDPHEDHPHIMQMRMELVARYQLP